MTNLEKYDEAFINSFGVTASDLPTLAYQSISAWDSVGQMQLIAALEDAFDIMFDTDDIIDFNSYENGKEFMKKYAVIL
ncbi:MAG: acyl carrier protein [Christensenella sp.]